MCLCTRFFLLRFRCCLFAYWFRLKHIFLPRLFYTHILSFLFMHFARLFPFWFFVENFWSELIAKPTKDGKMFTIWITFAEIYANIPFGREEKKTKMKAYVRKYVWREGKICEKGCFLWIKGISNIFPANILYTYISLEKQNVLIALENW